MDFVSLDRRAIEPELAGRGRALLERARAACDAAEATFWVVSEDGTALLGALNVGRTPEAVEGAEVPIGRSLIGMVASLQLAVSSGPEASFNRSVDARTGTATQAMVAAPVTTDGRLCGVLSAINPRSAAGSFSPEQLEALQEKARELGKLLVPAAAQASAAADATRSVRTS